MDRQAPLLSRHLLEEYEKRLRAAGAPFDEWALPGLDGGEIESTLAPLGLKLPIEGRIWWEWHDWATRSGQMFTGMSGKEYLSLRDAVATYEEFRRLVLQLVEPDDPDFADPEKRWNRSWFPFRGTQHPLVLDCSVPDGTATPIRHMSLEEPWGSPMPRASSLGETVTWATEALERGVARWDKGRRVWARNPDAEWDPEWDIDLL